MQSQGLLEQAQGPRYLTVQEVAEELRLSYKSALGLIRRDEIPAKRIGRLLRVRREDLDAALRPASAAGGQ